MVRRPASSPENSDTTSTEVTVLPVMGGKSLSIAGGRFRVAAQVTRTVLTQEDEIPFYVEFQSCIGVSRMDPDNSKFRDKEGVGVLPDVANVLNLETGECQVLICNAVLSSEIQAAYPEHGYVGRCFGIRRGRSQLDKRYKVYEIVEISRVLDDSGETVAVTKEREIDATGADAIDRAKESRQR